MKFSKKTSGSKIKLLLEGIALFVSLIFLLVLCLPFFSPQLLNFFLRNKGIEFGECPINKTKSLKLQSPECTFSFPLAEGRVQVMAKEIEISYINNTTFPVLNVDSVVIELPDVIKKMDSNKKSSFKDLNFPFSEFHLKKGYLHIEKNPVAEFNTDLFDLSGSNHGSAKVNLHPINLQKDTLLKPYLEKLKLPLQINEGTIDLDADLSIKDLDLDKNSTVTITAHKVSGQYNEFEFNNLNFNNLTFTNYPLWEIKKPTPVSIQSIDTNTGISVEKIQLRLGMNKKTEETSKLLMEAVKADIFGGQISSEHIVIEDSKPQPFILDLTAVDLSLLLGLSGKSITGTGKISGKLPINFEDQKLSVKNGFLQALAPGGEIHYTPTTEALETVKQDQNTSSALKALEEFYYDQMEIKLQYDQKGILLANISLQGKNPKIFNGRKIQFNINVEENILSLLKSLRLATQVKKRGLG